MPDNNIFILTIFKTSTSNMKKIALLGLIVSSLVLTGCGGMSEADIAKQQFAQCITDAGFKMYGASWCPHCKEQKEMFWLVPFESIDYVECTQKQTTCDIAWVNSYPTWIGSGYKQSGIHSFEQLAKITGCQAPEL